MDPLIQWGISGLIATLVTLLIKYLDKSDEDIKRRLVALEKFDIRLNLLEQQGVRVETKLDILMERK